MNQTIFHPVRLFRRKQGRYRRRQLRRLQQRVRHERSVTTKILVYASIERSEIDELRHGDIEPAGVNQERLNFW